jgi:hypothetical protein
MTKLFEVWIFLIVLGFSKTGLWTITTGPQQRMFLCDVSIVKQGKNKGLQVIIGPFLITVGVVL